MSVVLLVTSYVRSDVMLAMHLAASGGEIMPSYRKLLIELTDSREFPALHAVIAAGVLDQDDSPDVEFTFGLDRILDGIETLMQRRASPG